MTTQSSRELHIAEGKKRKDDLEITYECVAKLRGDPSILETISNASEILSLAWVTRSNGFAINIDIWPIHDQQHEDLFEKLMQALQTTNMWSDLCLLASIQRTGQSCVSIYLQHDETAISQPNSNGKLQVGHTSKLRPPVGTPVIQLEQVDLCLGLRNQSPKPHGDYSLDDPMQSSDHTMTISQASDYQLSQERQITDLSLNSSFYSLIDDEEEDTSRIANSTPTEVDIDHDVSRNCVPGPPRSSLESTRNNSIYRRSRPSNTDTQLDLKFPLQLIDSVLRVSLLGGRPTIRLDSTQNRITSRLPQLCPSIFSPGYLKAVNERSYLIPSISRALTQISSRSPRYNTISTSISMNSIETQLWKVAWPRLYNVKSSARLSPLVDMAFDENEGEDLSMREPEKLGAHSLEMMDLLDHFWDIADSSSLSQFETDGEIEEDLEFEFDELDDWLEEDDDLADNQKFEDFEALYADGEDRAGCMIDDVSLELPQNPYWPLSHDTISAGKKDNVSLPFKSLCSDL